jgi:signal transduction histidine kinase
VESCLTIARPLAERAGLILGTQYAPHLPRIVADEQSLKQMLLNLLANAIKFARRGDRVTIAVGYEAGGALRISVADTGPGMASGSEQTACALAGARPGAARPDGAGLGLGLPLTRALAAANGAALAIESETGQGTCVTISFGPDRIVGV